MKTYYELIVHPSTTNNMWYWAVRTVDGDGNESDVAGGETDLGPRVAFSRAPTAKEQQERGVS